MSLRVEIIGIEMSIVIPRNTSIPNTKKGHYTTNYDNQTTILYSGIQGWENKNSRYQLLVRIWGVAQIDVCFDTESNGILNVSVEMTSGLRSKITFTCDKARLSNEEIKRMIKDAEKYNFEDDENRKKVEAKEALLVCILALRACQCPSFTFL